MLCPLPQLVLYYSRRRQDIAVVGSTSHDPDAHRPGVDGYEVLCLQEQELEAPACGAECRDEDGAGFYADYRIVLNLAVLVLVLLARGADGEEPTAGVFPS